MHGWARRWGTARLSVTFIIVALVVAACGGGDGEGEQMGTFTLPRTYDQLDLGTPQAAVAEFNSAFARRDFVTAMLLLHPSTQAKMATDVTNADFSTWVMPDVEPAVRARIEIERGGDHRLDALRVFEIAMEEATVNGGFRVDLAGGVEDVTVRAADAFTAVVDGVLATSQEPVVFELAPSPDGRWRVRHVGLTNGSAADLPFSGQPALGSPVRTLDIATTWRATLPNRTPTELVQTVASLVAAEDHFSLYLLLDAPAQREVDQLLPPGGSDQHQVTAAVLDDVLDQGGFPIDLGAIEVGDTDPAGTDAAGPGDSLTFMVADGAVGLDVTVTLDSAGGWRLHRIAVVGDLASPVPFPVA